MKNLTNEVGETGRAARTIPTPADYFRGSGSLPPVLPANILLFTRCCAADLQRRTFASLPHHRYVLIVCLDTAGTVHVDNLALPVKPGMGLLIFPFQFHHYSDLRDDSLRWLFISFEGGGMSRLGDLRDNPVELDATSLQLIRRCIAAFNTGKDEDELVLHTALMLRQISRCRSALLTTERRSNPLAQSTLIQQVNDQLGTSPADTPSISSIAARLGYSERHLRLLFRHQFGLPLGLYIRRRRMTRMMALLQHSGLNLTEIAIECGYNSLAAFSRAFKTLTGKSPGSYRKDAGVNRGFRPISKTSLKSN